jgi:hypothetical protein
VQSSYPVRGLNERAARYRQLSARADAAAAQSGTEGLRAGWRKIAMDWNDLALEVECQLRTAETQPGPETNPFPNLSNRARQAGQV